MSDLKAAMAELVDEAIRSAMDTVQVGDFRDPSQAYKDKDAAEEKARLMRKVDSLIQCAECLRDISKPPETADMSYPKDLDEYSYPELAREISRRFDLTNRGLCDYCGRQLNVEPSCKFLDRHSDKERKWNVHTGNSDFSG